MILTKYALFATSYVLNKIKVSNYFVILIENSDITQLMRMNTGKAKNDFYIFVYLSYKEN